MAVIGNPSLVFPLCSHISRQESSPNCAFAQPRFHLFTPLGKKPPLDRYLRNMSNPLHPRT